MDIKPFLQSPDKSLWQGRADSEAIERFYQSVTIKAYADFLNAPVSQSSVVILGFACDEGVKRNQGRVGAKKGPNALRQALANYPLHGNAEKLEIIDIGNIVCLHEDLEASQQALAQVVAQIVAKGCFPLILGGGHETAWGHYLGLHQKYQKSNLAIVNFDAHFDMRPLVKNQGNSGTSFLQIAMHRQQNKLSFDYYCFGIKATSNTKSLFETAKKWNVKYISCDEMYASNDAASNAILKIIEQHETIYVTLCMDVFSSGISPGVSAASPYGLAPWQVLPLLRTLADSEKVIALDVVELAPAFDKENQTAKLGGICIAEFLYHSKKGVKP